eukprot:EC795285.1.p1 GENE.EC795285.1~~EC795285.1.p1  ORF type:complete len:107 (+),score=6.38 EC795285.1:239-559(+)
MMHVSCDNGRASWRWCEQNEERVRSNSMTTLALCLCTAVPCQSRCTALEPCTCINLPTFTPHRRWCGCLSCRIPHHTSQLLVHVDCGDRWIGLVNRCLLCSTFFLG